MDDAIKAAKINVAVARCLVTAAGYTAENEQRKAVGNSMAYTADSFIVLVAEMDGEIGIIERSLV